jgi:hypothetical protein
MRVWLDCNILDHFFDDSSVKLGIGWYRHHPDHRWKGITIHIYLLRWLVSINLVDNWVEYNKKINRSRK